MNFGTIMLNQNIETKQNYVTWIQLYLHFKTDDFYKDIEHDVEKWFDTSNYDDNVDI